MTQERVPVLIVGAGAAGFTLSLLLQQQGIPSLLVELPRSLNEQEPGGTPVSIRVETRADCDLFLRYTL